MGHRGGAVNDRVDAARCGAHLDVLDLAEHWREVRRLLDGDELPARARREREREQSAGERAAPREGQLWQVRVRRQLANGAAGGLSPPPPCWPWWSTTTTTTTFSPSCTSPRSYPSPKTTQEMWTPGGVRVDAHEGRRRNEQFSVNIHPIAVHPVDLPHRRDPRAQVQRQPIEQPLLWV